MESCWIPMTKAFVGRDESLLIPGEISIMNSMLLKNRKIHGSEDPEPRNQLYR